MHWFRQCLLRECVIHYFLELRSTTKLVFQFGTPKRLALNESFDK